MKSKTLNFVKIRGQIIAPMDDETAQQIERKADGVCFEVREVGNIRSPQFHRKFFKMIRVAYDNLPEQFNYPEFENFRSALLIAAGHYDTIAIPVQGELIEYRIPKSISYNALSDSDFSKLYDDTHRALLETFGIDYETLQDFF